MNYSSTTQVLCGDMGESPLEVLSVFSSEVALPLLRQQVSHGAWPNAAALEVANTLQEFASSGKLPPQQSKEDCNAVAGYEPVEESLSCFNTFAQPIGS